MSEIEPLTVDELREAIIRASDLEGAYGQNMPETKPVLIHTGDDTYLPLVRVSVTFVNFRGTAQFALVLTPEGMP